MMSLREITLTERMRHPEWTLEKCRLIAGRMLTQMNERRLNGRPAWTRKVPKPEAANTSDTTPPNRP
jgi:hypothetical protein